MPVPAYLVVLADPDPVARDVATELGVGESLGVTVDGVPVRRLSGKAASLRRPVLHIRDDGIDTRLPAEWAGTHVPLVFPSVHRSERGDPALTVHPLGNPTPDAEVGGQPEVLVPTVPRLMVDGLRKLFEGAGSVGLPASYEATHHGPGLKTAAFFIEVGGRDGDSPPPTATKLIAKVVRDLAEDPADSVVLGVGGGHYAPHFTDLAVRRRLAFGHILPRHVLDRVGSAVARAAWDGTPGAAGVVYARASDAARPIARAWGGRFREADAPRRGPAIIPTGMDGGARSSDT